MVSPFFLLVGDYMCEYSIDKSNFLTKILVCSIDNEPCTLCRFCKTLNKMVMSDFYNKYGCKTKNKYKESMNTNAK